MVKLTKAKERALTIIRDENITRPSQFARKYFKKDHPGWTRQGKCGAYGSTSGGGLILWAGGYLGKLKKLGLVLELGSDHGYRLTRSGKELLRDGDL